MKVLLVGAAAAATLLLIRGFAGCGSERVTADQRDAGDDSADVHGLGGAPGDAPADSQVVPWDPVWHKTTPANFPVIPPGPALKVDCGERCKVISSAEPEGISTRRPRANDEWAVFQVAPGRVHAVALATGIEYLVDDGKDWPGAWGSGLPSLSGGRVFYVISKPDMSILVLRDLLTGERKEVWAAKKVNTGDGVATMAFAGPYLYWEHGPPERFYRFHVQTGELKSLSGGGCFFLEGAETGFATCAGEGWVALIDFDKGTVSAIEDTQAGAGMGGISPDGKTIAWSDLRHPGPSGEQSSFFAPLAGSEVYALDVASGKETRLTFDSPAKPALKTFARVVGDTIVWHSLEGTEDPTPESDLGWQTGGPVWFRRGAGPNQRLRDPPDWLLYAQPATKGVVAVWTLTVDGGSNSAFLAFIDWPPLDGGVTDAGGQ